MFASLPLLKLGHQVASFMHQGARKRMKTYSRPRDNQSASLSGLLRAPPFARRSSLGCSANSPLACAAVSGVTNPRGASVASMAKRAIA
jgi:hypothetical protein